MASLRERARRWNLLDVLERLLPTPLARLIAWLRTDEFLLTAASLAFFALISLVPVIVIALWITGAVIGEDRISQLGARVSELAPDELIGEEVVGQLIEVSTTAGWAAILGAVWPATAYGAALARALDRLTPDADAPMDAVKGRGLAIALIAALPLLVIAAFLLLLFGPRIVGEGIATRALGLVGASAVGLAVVTGFLGLVYDLFSPKDVGWRAALQGGAVGAASVIAVSLGYVAYLRFGADFQERYASSAIAAMVMLALWLYLANGALIAGYKAALKRGELGAWRQGRWGGDSAGGERQPGGIDKERVEHRDVLRARDGERQSGGPQLG